MARAESGHSALPTSERGPHRGAMAIKSEPIDVVDAPAGMTRLAVNVPASVGRDRALAVLDEPGRSAWLGEVVVAGIGDEARKRYLVDLELRLRELPGLIAFRKAAYVDIGPISASSRGPIRIGISWRAAGLAPLFPVFSGTLAWSEEELQLEGWYAPPGGGIGILADRLLLNVAARGTARLLLERIAAAMRGSQS
jgi:hypothetical protein